jgi:enoyl-CoA hydratase/carnithine racemase
MAARQPQRELEVYMDYKEIIYGVAGRIATVTLNRPDRLNAWTRTMAEEVRHAIYDAADDERVRVIVLTGQGRGFCAGADMAELQGVVEQGGFAFDETGNPEHAVSAIVGTRTEEERSAENRLGTRSDFRKRYSYLPSILKPIIAAVNGPAMGLGLVMALYCDLRFASESARFSTAFSRRGLIAEHGISWILPRLVGLPNALDLLLSGRIIDAHEAKIMGLVNGVFNGENLMDGVMAYASDMAASVSPRSLAVIKRQVYEAQFQTLAEATFAADRELILSLQSEDFREGITHFLERRPPVFPGK